MKVLIVCSKNSGRIAPFIEEQVDSLRKLGVDIDYFGIEQKGFLGYLKTRKKLLSKISEFKPDLIHAHYGLSGLLANLQRKIPVITTYHGSDLNNKSVYPFSCLSVLLSTFNLFISTKLSNKVGFSNKSSVIPCGVDLSLFIEMDKKEARKLLGFDETKKIVLFAGAFANTVKNASLAQKAVSLVPTVELIELKGYTRQQVVWLMNAVDVVIMTSFTEGSPQFIKEAMACGCPIVSVDVGDVAEVVNDIDGCFVARYDEFELAEKIKLALLRNDKTSGRSRIIELELSLPAIARRVFSIYKSCIKPN